MKKYCVMPFSFMMFQRLSYEITDTSPPSLLDMITEYGV